LVEFDPYLELRKQDIKKQMESNFETYEADIKEKALNSFILTDKNEEAGLEFIKKVMKERF